MKKKLLCILFFVCLAEVFFAKAGETKYVFVEKSALKSGSGFFAAKIAEVHYGDAVLIISEKGRWAQVSLKNNPALIGWIASGSLTSKKILSSSNKVSASAEELALAGKGFTAEIENEYRSKGTYDYAAVDELEKKSAVPEELYEFITDGHLKGAEE